jgi:uncharacterized protein YxeA
MYLIVILILILIIIIFIITSVMNNQNIEYDNTNKIYHSWIKKKNILLSNHKFENLQIGVVGLAIYLI